MNSFDTFKQSIVNKIKEIDAEYKQLYKDYRPTENEKKLISFLDDIWGLRFQDDSLNEKFQKASVQLFFIDKDNKTNCVDKSFRLAKLHPKQPKTTPLYFLIARLAMSKEYDFYLCPNIFQKTQNRLHNWESNISISNCYFVDIDEIHTKKPIYNCTEDEILAYLYTQYPILKQLSPSYILMSGGGLHLYFTLAHTEYLFGNAYTNQTRRLHKILTGSLITLLRADVACKNLNRLLRVPFSYNLKYPVKTRFYIYPTKQTYSYEQLNNTVSSVLPASVPEAPVRTKITSSKVSAPKITEQKEPVQRNYNTTPEERSLIAAKAREKLFLDRKSDIEKWFFLHLKDMEGHRHHFFLIYSIILKQLHNRSDYIETRCRILNAKLFAPLPESELIKTISQEHYYLFRNETIAEWLDYTQEEIAMMNCNYGADAIREHNRKWSVYYNELRKEERHQRKERKQLQIFKIIAENPDATLCELATLLGCHKSTVIRWKKKYKDSLSKDL